MIILVLTWRKSLHFWRKYEQKRFHIFVPSDLDLWSLDLKFAPLVTLVQRYVFTELEVSKAFLFQKSEGRDRRTGCNT